jgi:hypothetical protein
VCTFCNKTNHCDRFCWDKHPEQRPAHLKANTVSMESDDSTELDITKVKTK